MTVQLPPLPSTLPEQRWMQLLVDKVNLSVSVQLQYGQTISGAQAIAAQQSIAMSSSQVLYWLG